MAVSVSHGNASNATYKRWLRFSLLGLLTVCTLLAVGLAAWRIGLWDNGLFLLFVIEAVAVLACVELLIRNMPKTIQASIAKNTKRLDGTRSRHRERVEKRALQKLRWDLLVVLLLIAAPGNLLLFAIHAYVIPLPIGLDAVAVFSTTPGDWKQSLRDDGIERRYTNWHKQKSGRLNATGTNAMKQFVWRGWPFIVGMCVVWFVVSLLVLKSVYIAALREFAEQIESRAVQYRIRDLARSQPASTTK